jgi:16S rRNA (uracil1498-N3)-methyltransferase
MQVFYLPEIIVGINFLDPEESHHCSKVLRMSSGEAVMLIDGKGTMAEGELLKTDPKKSQIIVKTIRHNYNLRPYSLHIAIAPTKSNSRFEWFLEKATELGIDEISPIFCDRSERKTSNIIRSKKIIRSAMKQSITAFEPKINEIKSFSKFAAENRYMNTFMAYCDGQHNKHLKDVSIPKTETCVIVGPEGGFSPEEVKLAQLNNIELVSLGKSRLRTETAGLVICQIFNLINQ